MKYTLTDGVVQNRESPATFSIPSDGRKAAIRPGDFVKVGVKFTPPEGEQFDGERFWVEVSEVADGKLRGKINNDLVFTPEHGLKCDDPLEVELRHVLGIMSPPPKR